MATSAQDYTTQVRSALRQRVERLQAKQRKATLLALGILGITTDQARRGLAGLREFADQAIQRGERFEQELCNLRSDVQHILHAATQDIYARGKAAQAELNALCHKCSAPPPVAQDIPISTGTSTDTQDPGAQTAPDTPRPAEG